MGRGKDGPSSIEKQRHLQIFFVSASSLSVQRPLPHHSASSLPHPEILDPTLLGPSILGPFLGIWPSASEMKGVDGDNSLSTHTPNLLDLQVLGGSPPLTPWSPKFPLVTLTHPQSSSLQIKLLRLRPHRLYWPPPSALWTPCPPLLEAVLFSRDLLGSPAFTTSTKLISRLEEMLCGHITCRLGLRQIPSPLLPNACFLLQGLMA